jgi:hypothetical protein
MDGFSTVDGSSNTDFFQSNQEFRSRTLCRSSAFRPGFSARNLERGGGGECGNKSETNDMAGRSNLLTQSFFNAKDFSLRKPKAI